MVLAHRRILVVGGGLIGTEVALTLRRAGQEVRVLSRSIGVRLGALGPDAGVEVVEAEVGTGLALAEALADVDAVICLAGSSTPAAAAADPGGALSGSVSPVLTALESARDAGVGRVIVASSGGTVYGEGAPTPTPEDAPLRPSSLHGVNSLTVEAFAGFYRREAGMEVSVLRFSNVYGPGAEPRRGQGVIAAWCRALALGRPAVLIGPETARRDFVFATDAAEAVRLALTAPPGTYNVGGGETVSLGALLEHLRRATGREPVVERRPGRGVDVPVTHLDTKRLRAATGWEPRVGLDEGIGEVWAWETRGASEG